MDAVLGMQGRVSHTGSNPSQVSRSCLGLSFFQASIGQSWYIACDTGERMLCRGAVSQ
jgi:hypothetical protein